MNKIIIKPIGYIHNDYKEKFGIPRQSGLSESVVSKIVFEDEYKDQNYFKGLEEFSHIWLIWYFSDVNRKHIKPTVRPPKLGGNKRVGVFASRSPFRPNRIGISCVKLIKVDYDYKKITLYVTGADLMDGTPIIDIKPYLPYTDSRPEASNGFALDDTIGKLEIKCNEKLLSKIPIDIVDGLFETLKHDPRPSYQDDSERVYGMSYGNLQIKFCVKNDILTIIDIL